MEDRSALATAFPKFPFPLQALKDLSATPTRVMLALKALVASSSAQPSRN